MFATFPICFLVVEVVKMVGSNLEHGTSFWSGMSHLLSNNGNDLQMQEPVPLSWDILGGAMVFPAVTQLLTNSSHPRSRNLVHLETGAVHQRLSPFWTKQLVHA
jgi:hypothetical protein